MLDLLVEYVTQPRESIAALGIKLLQDLICKVAAAIEDWQPALQSLSIASSAELASPLLRSAFARNPIHLKGIKV